MRRPPSSTLFLHDALPIYDDSEDSPPSPQCSDGRDNDGDGKIDYPNDPGCLLPQQDDESEDRKSTRLNSSHPSISYAVFCLKKNNRSLLQTTTARPIRQAR